MKCRHCATELDLCLIDLGSAPPSNAYLSAAQLCEPELWYPLRIRVCESCWLTQTEDFARAEELFAGDYAYFSSYSTTWLEHVRGYVSDMTKRLKLNAASQVVEVAANDGYLLRFVRSAGIPCYGIEPTASTAAAARKNGIDIVQDFFGTTLAGELAAAGRQADLMIANNVLAHVPDINDFVSGFRLLLKADGVATFEFPHLLRLLAESQFDTIYHEHYSYLSLTSVVRIFNACGLHVFDVDELPTHGGSLRVFAQHADGPRRTHEAVSSMLECETRFGLTRRDTYLELQTRAETIKNALLRFLIDRHDRGERVAGYGAAAKGNTLLNFAGVRPDLLPYVVDRNPHKQGQFLPGSRIPVVNEERLWAERPDYVLILPWNLRDEISSQLATSRDWGGQFVTAVPEITVW